MSEATRQLALDQLVPRKGNRQVGGMPKESLQELAASISERGILQPLIVRPLPDDMYEIVAGERRAKAAKLAGAASASCFVREMTDAEADQVAVIDNLHRADLHPMDEASAYAAIHEQQVHAGAVDAIKETAARVGKSTRYVLERIQLTRLVQSARDLWRKNENFTLGHALLIARLPIEVQERLMKALHQQMWALESRRVSGFADWIQREVYMELNKAPWKMDDAELLPRAGPCVNCPKRTGANAALFPEIGKGDICLDSGCFAKKAEAFVAKKKAELKDEPHLLVSTEYGTSKAALSRYQWEPAKKGEKGAVKCLVVQGEGIGKVGWAVRRSQDDSGRAIISESEKAKRKKQLAEDRTKKDIREAIYRAIGVAAVEYVTAEELPIAPVEVLRLMAAEVFDRVYDRRALMKLELSWKDPSPQSYGHAGRRVFARMTPPGLVVAMVKCLAVQGLGQHSSAEDLMAIAKAYGVDAKRIEREIREEASAKKQVNAELARKKQGKLAKKTSARAKAATA